MDGSENDLRYQTKAYSVNNQQGYSSSIRLKVPARGAAMHSRVINQSAIDSNEDYVDDKEIGDDVEKIDGVRMIGKDTYDDDDEDDVSDDDDDDDDEAEEDDDDDDDDNGVGDKRYSGKMGGIGIERPKKKRKLKNLVSNYEFVPRVRTPPTHMTVQSEPSSVGRDIGANWTDRETFDLLNAWGDRFLKLGRKSLCSEDWQEVADKVSQEASVERTESQCRSRLEALKKKYRNEKVRSTTSGGDISNWVFFRKMDYLLCSPSQRPSSLSCGVDSGEYVFMNPKVYLNRANGLDEMRDSPENSETSRDNEDDSDGFPPKGKTKKGRRGGGSSFQRLADSIQKFSEIYEDIEINKRKQMVDLENMRMDFQRQIEMQTRQILEKAQAEIVKIRQQDGDE